MSQVILWLETYSADLATIEKLIKQVKGQPDTAQAFKNTTDFSNKTSGRRSQVLIWPQVNNTYYTNCTLDTDDLEQQSPKSLISVRF